MNWIIKTFGLRGSWSWACRQMDNGQWVRPASSTGSVKIKLDYLGQRRIVWTFARSPQGNADWESANIFLSDFESTDWVLCGPTPPTEEK